MTTQPDALNDDTGGIFTSSYSTDAGDGISRWLHFSKIVDGGSVALGKTTDATITNPSTNGTLMAFTRGILSRLSGGLPSALSSGGGLKTGLVDALPAGTNNIGDVDIVTMPALPAGTNLVGEFGQRIRQNNLTVKTAGVISASGNSGDLDTSTYNNAILVANVTALTGANFDLWWTVKFGANYYRVLKLTTTAISATGTYAYVVPSPMGPAGRVDWVLNSGTSWNMTADLLMEG